MAWNDGSNFAMGGFNMAQAMAGQQGGHLAGMANQTMAAIQRENESRVAQAREATRMGHEQGMFQQQMELERMRLENQRQMQRDNAANEIRKLKAVMAMQDSTGPRRRSFQIDPMNGQRRWMEDWET